MRKLIIISAMLFLTLAITPLHALENFGDENAAALKTIFNLKLSEFKAGKYFDASFLKAVPEDKIKQLLGNLGSRLGEFRLAVKTSEGSYNLIFSKGAMPSKISLSAGKLIKGLWFGAPTLADDSFEKISEELKKLDGTVSVAITRNGSEELFLMNADAPLGVGSAFKLYVLKALDEKIKAGGCDNKTVIELSRDKFSLPSGTLQSWPDKTPVTLKTLANFMISISDNTATDILIDYIGRDGVERCAPERVRPLLKTLEMFKIKWGLSKKERDGYVAAGLSGKRKILEDIAGMDKSKLKVELSEPLLIGEIEWHITTRELCKVIYELKDNPSLAINPGLADMDRWRNVGYKGGSEPGVLNYTHILQSKKNGDLYSISATINNETTEVQTEKFTELTGRLISLIEEEKFKSSK
ncbi:MAG TPA: serine hydrolase [Candidatus Wallbacteria bacterium]|nr:serine hydrolase [Candidatus Wallbacteria bacterium]